MVWQCYRRGGEEGEGEDECMRYDEIRAEGGGEKRRDELLMAQQVWPPLGNTGAWEEGRSPLRKGQREGESVCLYLYLCVCVCVASAHRASRSTTHNDGPPSSLQSMSRLPIETTAGQWELILSPCEPIRSKQWQGKLCHYEMHS